MLFFFQIKEFNRKKNERDKAYEDMVLKQKRDKEIEIGKVRASQQASQDLQAAKDELNMLRIQDQVILLIFSYKLLGGI